jgi:nucleoid-associated protein YgaU
MQEYHVHMAGRTGRLRALAALPLTASLVVALTNPPCVDEVSPKDQAVKAACKELDSDCCQACGERPPHSPVSVTPPDPAIAATVHAADLPTPGLARLVAATGPAAAPADFQGSAFSLS